MSEYVPLSEYVSGCPNMCPDVRISVRMSEYYVTKPPKAATECELRKCGKTKKSDPFEKNS